MVTGKDLYGIGLFIRQMYSKGRHITHVFHSQNKTAIKNIDDENNFSIFLLTTENTIRNSIKVELIKS